MMSAVDLNGYRLEGVESRTLTDHFFGVFIVCTAKKVADS